MSEETKAPETRGKRFGYLAMTLVLLFGLVAGSLAVAGLGMYRHHAMGFGHGWRGGGLQHRLQPSVRHAGPRARSCRSWAR